MKKRLYKSSIIFWVLATLTFLLANFFHSSAATYTWDNGAGDGLWSNPLNWSSNVLPGTGDIARFDSTSVANVSINMDIDVAGIQIANTYSGIITQEIDSDITIRGSGYTQDSGTFIGSNVNIVINNNGFFTLNQGAFTSTAGVLMVQRNFTITGGSFNHNNGTVRLNGDDDGDDTTMACNNSTFNLVELQKGWREQMITINSDCNIDLGTNVVSGGTIYNNGTMTIGTGYWNASGINHGTYLYTNAGATTTINATSLAGLRGLHNAGGNLTVSNLTQIDLPGDNWWGGGMSITTIAAVSSFPLLTTLNLDLASITLTAGTLTAPSLTSIYVDFNLNNSGDLLPDGVDIYFTQGNGDWWVDSIFTCGTATYGNISILKGTHYDQSLTINAGCTIDLGNAPNSSGLIYNYGTLTVGTGDWIANTISPTYIVTYTQGITTINANSVLGLGGLQASGGVITVSNLTALNLNVGIIDSNRPLAGIGVSGAGVLNIPLVTSINADYSSVNLTGGTLNAPALATVYVDFNFNNSGNVLPNGVDIYFTEGNGDWWVDSTFTCGNATYGIFYIRKGAHNDQSLTISVGCNVNIGNTPISSGIVYNYGTFVVGTGEWVANSPHGTYIVNYPQATTTINSSSIIGLRGVNASGGSITFTNLATLNINQSGSNWNLTGISLSGAAELHLPLVTVLNVDLSGISFAGGVFDAPNLTTIYVDINLNNSGNLLPDGIDIYFTEGNNDYWIDSVFTCGSAIYGDIYIRKGTHSDQSVTISSGCEINLGSDPTSSGIIYNYGTFSVGTGTWIAGSPHGTYLFTYTGATSNINATNITGLRGLHASGGTININNIASLGLNISGDYWNYTGMTITTGGIINIPNTTMLTAYRGYVTLSAGTLNAPLLSTFNFDRTFDNSGNILPSGVNLVHTGNNGNDWSYLTCGNAVLASLTTQPTDDNAYLRFEDNCQISGDFTRSRGNVNNPTAARNIYIGGSLIINGTTSYGGSNITYFLNGTGTQYLTKGYSGTFDSKIRIEKSSGYAILSTNFATTLSCDVVTGTLDLNGFNLTCTTGFNIQNNTTLALIGTESPTNPAFGSNNTLEYRGDKDGLADNFTLKAWNAANLKINTVDGAVDVYSFPAATHSLTGDVLIVSGTLNAPSTSLTLGGNWSNSGVFNHNSGIVVFNGGDQNISGSSIFNDFTKQVNFLSTLTFPGSGSDLQTIMGTLILNGIDGQLLRLRSSNPGTQWRFDPRGIRTISYLDVKDSNNINPSIMQTTGFNISNSGNNLGWDFDTEPQIQNIGPSAYVNGDYISDNTPTFSFVTYDYNGGDQVKFQIQIDDDADFLTPVIDYESALAAQGAVSYTVGQAQGSGNYAVGFEGQVLADGDYYLRIRGIDAQNNIGPYNTANSGNIAFRLNFTGPGSVTNLASTTHTVGVWDIDQMISVTWTPPNAALEGYSVVFDQNTVTEPDNTVDIGDVTTITSNQFSTGSGYYFHIKARSDLGQWGSTEHFGPFQIDITPPINVGNIAFIDGSQLPWIGSSQISITWVEPNDLHSGLDGYSYDFDSVADTEPDTIKDINNGVTQFQTPIMQLGQDYYFHIRAVDEVGNWGNITHFGPMRLDQTPPGIPGQPGLLSPPENPQPLIAWLGVVDNESGISHYKLQVSQDQNFLVGVFETDTDNSNYNFATDLNTGLWYARVRSEDNAGNVSSYSTTGSFELLEIIIIIPTDTPTPTPPPPTPTAPPVTPTEPPLTPTTTTLPGTPTAATTLTPIIQTVTQRIYLIQETTVYVTITPTLPTITKYPNTGTPTIPYTDDDRIVVIKVTGPVGEDIASLPVSLIGLDGNREDVVSDENGLVVVDNLEPGKYKVIYERADGSKEEREIEVPEVKGDTIYKSMEVNFTDPALTSIPMRWFMILATVGLVVLIFLSLRVVLEIVKLRKFQYS